MDRKEFYTVEIVVGGDVMERRFPEEHHARDCWQRLHATPYELRLWHNRSDGMNCRLDMRPANGGGF